jgi:hypothetical protein
VERTRARRGRAWEWFRRTLPVSRPVRQRGVSGLRERAVRSPVTVGRDDSRRTTSPRHVQAPSDGQRRACARANRKKGPARRGGARVVSGDLRGRTVVSGRLSVVNGGWFGASAPLDVGPHLGALSSRQTRSWFERGQTRNGYLPERRRAGRPPARADPITPVRVRAVWRAPGVGARVRSGRGRA